MFQERKTILVYNEGIAEALVYEHKLNSLVGIERSKRTQGRKAFEFIASAALINDLNAMVKDLRSQKNQRLKANEPSISVSEHEAIKAVNASDLLPEDDGKPKGKKKKVDVNRRVDS